jgi:hypothetical protein
VQVWQRCVDTLEKKLSSFLVGFFVALSTSWIPISTSETRQALIENPGESHREISEAE